MGMAAGLKRDAVVILRFDGEELLEFLKSPTFETDVLSIFSEIGLPDRSLRDCIMEAFAKLTVDQGMPPATDPWVVSNIVEPVLQSLDNVSQQTVSQEAFSAEFKRAIESVAQHLKEKPSIVAHSQNTFDGSGFERLLSNKFELHETLNSAIEIVPKNQNGEISKEYFRGVLEILASSAGLPPIGALDQIDHVTTEALKMFEVNEQKMVNEEEFKKLLTQVLETVVQHLEANPISVSVNSIVHEPHASSSTSSSP
ncbi:2 calcium sensor [Olea europaea subsp. europaea]|uniref:2 calcium sensor n=1 Tax=Olea europaea subsp. europaea TaxID=158383 RepID=A0A8S0QJ46_OLEEU|nr:2 calcium sensor [Olea europaea subsp. europaea]